MRVQVLDAALTPIKAKSGFKKFLIAALASSIAPIAMGLPLSVVESPIADDPLTAESGLVASKMLPLEFAYLGVPDASAPPRDLRWKFLRTFDPSQCSVSKVVGQETKYRQKLIQPVDGQKNS